MLNCLPKRPRQTVQTETRSVPFLFAILASILGIPALITKILLRTEKINVFENLEHGEISIYF